MPEDAGSPGANRLAERRIARTRHRVRVQHAADAREAGGREEQAKREAGQRQDRAPVADDQPRDDRPEEHNNCPEDERRQGATEAVCQTGHAAGHVHPDSGTVEREVVVERPADEERKQRQRQERQVPRFDAHNGQRDECQQRDEDDRHVDDDVARVAHPVRDRPGRDDKRR
ncbi:hypothetical protein ACFPRL_29910 [Pseudoclavibacter helvolus]